MSKLPHLAKTQIAAFPEVLAVVVTDDADALLEASGEIDSEALGAVQVVTMPQRAVTASSGTRSDRSAT